tara:strand:+ start:1815 stop:2018 length:204 start_codon:yes stop_codon:yes gene_type:complete
VYDREKLNDTSHVREAFILKDPGYDPARTILVCRFSGQIFNATQLPAWAVRVAICRSGSSLVYSRRE